MYKFFVLFFRSLLFLLISSLLLIFKGELSWADAPNPVVLVVNYHDQDDPNIEYGRELQRQMKLLQPEKKVIYVEADRRIKLRAKLTEAFPILSRDEIETFIFISHGAHQVMNGRVVSAWWAKADEAFAISVPLPQSVPDSALNQIDSEEEGPVAIPYSVNAEKLGGMPASESHFRYVLEPILGRFTKKARILFDGCNLMHPNPLIAKAQLQSLKTFLDVKSGSIYSNYTIGVVPLSWRLVKRVFSKPYFRISDPSARFIVLNFQRAALAVVLAFAGNTLWRPAALNRNLGALAILGVSIPIIYKIVRSIKNKGFLLSFHGITETLEPFTWDKALRKTLGIHQSTCAKLLDI